MANVMERDDNGVPINLDWKLWYAQAVIKDTYGDEVSVIQKLKALRKFGSNDLVGQSRATVMTLPTGETDEVLVGTNVIDTVSSSSTSDTTQTITLLEGHTISGTDLIFSTSTPGTELTGRTNAALPVSLGRITRARLSAPAVGDIYFHTGGATTNGVPNDLATVHMMIPAGEIQSQKASTAISSSDYWIVNSVTAGVLEKTAAYVQVRVEIKPFAATNTSWYPITEWLTVASGGGTRELVNPSSPYLIIPKNHDVRLSAIADGASTPITGGISGFLAKII